MSIPQIISSFLLPIFQCLQYTFFMTNLESRRRKTNILWLVGIDEVGRGAWAGPVAVGGYMFSLNSKVIAGIKDSKLLSSKQRETLYKKIYEPVCSFVEFGDVDTINKFGINNTITTLIKKVISKTFRKESYYLIDGIFKDSFTQNCSKIIKGDLLHYSISCASILAKVSRDKAMDNLSKQYPDYHFDLNKGYGTQKHQDALKIYGITKIHRINYKPIALLYKSNGNRYS